jgi:hypothetical protein
VNCQGAYPDSPAYTVPVQYSWSEATICRQDATRLHPVREVNDNIREIFLPLTVLVTDEHLHPYVWGFRDVTFYYDYVGGTKALGCRWEVPRVSNDCVPGWPHWSIGHLDEVIASDFDLWELTGGRCVFHRGQWCMRFGTRRIAWINQIDLDLWTDDGGAA